MTYYTLHEAATQLGQAYHRIYYAVVTGKVPRPQQVGHSWLFTDADIERLRVYFVRKRQMLDAIMAKEGREERIPTYTPPTDQQWAAELGRVVVK